MDSKIPQLIYELALKTRVLRTLIVSQKKEESLSEREMLILEQLKKHDSMTVSEVAASIGEYSLSTISVDLSHLWREKGFIEKTIDPGNQRQKIIKLTKKGQKATDVILKVKRQIFGTIIDALDMNPDEQIVIRTVLERALPRMEEKIGKLQNSTTDGKED